MSGSPSDLVLAALWVGVLVLGLGAVAGIRALGGSATDARDLLHVGAGVWVVGWPWWDGVVAPMAIVGAALVGTVLIGAFAPRVPLAERLRRGVAGGDEQFGGLVVYTASFAAMTGLGLLHRPFPAAAALLALALGDGLGGLVGRRFGQRSYRTGWGKEKTVEGSAAVAGFAAAGVAATAALFGAPVGVWGVVVLGLVAAGTEGLAPRGTDNAVVPAAVWLVAMLVA